MTKKALNANELLCDNQRHSRFTLGYLTFEGAYIWSVLIPGYAGKRQTIYKRFYSTDTISI